MACVNRLSNRNRAYVFGRGRLGSSTPGKVGNRHNRDQNETWLPKEPCGQITVWTGLRRLAGMLFHLLGRVHGLVGVAHQLLDVGAVFRIVRVLGRALHSARSLLPPRASQSAWGFPLASCCTILAFVTDNIPLHASYAVFVCMCFSGQRRSVH